MNDFAGEFLTTDFGHEVYDSWYLKQGRYNFESREFVERHFPFYEEVLQLSKNDYILEAGCGIGSYTRVFARHGYHIVGMDLSHNFLAEAKKIAQHENLAIDFILGDYNKMSFESQFSVIFFEGSFFYTSKEGLIALLSRIHKALKVNGRLYFVHHNQDSIKKRLPWTKQDEIEKDVFVIQQAEYDENDDVEKCSWIRINHKTKKHYRCNFTVMHLSPVELRESLMAAGFNDFHFYKKREIGDFDPKNDNGFSVVAKK